MVNAYIYPSEITKISNGQGFLEALYGGVLTPSSRYLSIPPETMMMLTRQTQKIVQCWTNVEDVGLTLYKCFVFAGNHVNNR